MTSRSTVRNLICLLVFLGMNPAPSATQLNRFTTSNDQDQSPTRQEYRYQEQEQALGITREGIRACFVTYESSDGISVFTRSEYFRSADDTETHFKTQTKSFAQIIARSEMKDVKDCVKGERILGRHSPNKEGTEMYSIMRNDSRTIRYIESTSLDHVLDFEKQVYKFQE